MASRVPPNPAMNTYLQSVDPSSSVATPSPNALAPAPSAQGQAPAPVPATPPRALAQVASSLTRAAFVMALVSALLVIAALLSALLPAIAWASPAAPRRGVLRPTRLRGAHAVPRRVPASPVQVSPADAGVDAATMDAALAALLPGSVPPQATPLPRPQPRSVRTPPPPRSSRWRWSLLLVLAGWGGGVGAVCALLARRLGLRHASKRAPPQQEPVPMEVEAPASPRDTGAHSRVGNTRRENQDRVRTAVVEEVGLLCLADGLGGPLHGAEAADLASEIALDLLRQGLPEALRGGLHAVRALLLASVWTTGVRMACAAKAQCWVGPDAGFCTTLILVAVLPEHYVCAWIGDGGVLLSRAGGDLVQLLDPHKDPAQPEQLHAHLGPQTEGRPGWSLAARKAGDVLLAGTDGVIESMSADTLAARVRAELQTHGGDVRKAVEAVVQQIEALADAEGAPLVTDNLTLAVTVTGEV